jgi:hypothetical protein
MLDIASLSEDEQWAFLTDFMGVIGEKVSAARPAPFEAAPLGPELVVVLAEWALSLYKGVLLLLRRRLPDPAQLLARTLLEDAIRLAYFRLQPEKLEELAVRWTVEALTEERSLQISAEHEFPAAGKFVADPSVELEALRARAKAEGWSTQKLPEVKDMAKAIDRLELYWVFKLYSTKVHTSRLALGSVMHTDEEGMTWLGTPGSLQDAIRVGRASTDALIISFFSMADLLGWEPQKEELHRISVANHQFFDELMDAAGFGATPDAPAEPES